MKQKLAIVILNWNGKKLLARFLPNVIRYSNDASIYVIDNGSTDDSVAYLYLEFPNVKCIPLQENLGYAGGYNMGLKEIEAEFYCLLNNDVKVTPDWTLPILQHFEKQQETAIVQPHILDFNKPDYFEYAGAAGGYIDRLGFPYCRGRIINTIEKDEGQYNRTQSIFWASGACFFIRKSVFDLLEGFDTDFFAHQEEIDLCWRAHHRGYTSVAIGQSKVYHIGGASLPLSARKIFLNHRNSLFMLLKNLPKKKLILTLLERMLWDGAIAVVHILTFRPKYFFAVIQAHGHFYRNTLKMRAKRNALNQNFKYFRISNVLKAYYLFNFKKISSFE